MHTIKTLVAGLASAAAIAVIATPLAAADTTPNLLRDCKITNDLRAQELAIDLTLDEPEVLTKMNDLRAQHGVEPLEFDREVTGAALIFSRDSDLRGFTPPDRLDTLGRGPQERLDACGVTWKSTSELVYSATDVDVTTSGTGAFDAWEGTDEGLAILNPEFTKVGIALSYNCELHRVHWTVVFTD